MTRDEERAHCEAVVDVWAELDDPYYVDGEYTPDEVCTSQRSIADLIARERAAARAEGLEEAAKVCDLAQSRGHALERNSLCFVGENCARAIRALKSGHGQ